MPDARRYLVATWSLPGRNRSCPTAETQVETGAHDALGLRDIGECRAQSGDLRREADLGGAEIVIAILDEAGQEIGEGVFATDGDGPSRAGRARRIGRPENGRRRPIVVALPGATPPAVAETEMPSVADATGDGRQRPDLAVIGD